jgi:HK97 family phage portal protein
MIVKAFKNSYSDFVKDFLSGDDIDRQDITINSTTAMKYTAVFSCVRVLSETLASTPIKIYKTNAKGERESVKDINLYDILHNKPNEEMSPFNFKEMMMTNLNLGGNTVCEKLVNKKGDLVGLYPYKWQNVTIERSKTTNKLEYIIKGEKGTEKTLRRDQVFHIPGLSFDGIVGLSPIEYVSKAIGLGLSYESFGVNFYKNGANPSIALQYPNALDDVAFERLKKEFAKAYQGLANTGKPLILEDGATVKEMTIKPVDAQLLESKRFQLEDIARIYRVPLHLIQDLERATFSNIEHQSLNFATYTMLPWFQRWEENINMQLLTPQQRAEGYYAEFCINNLLRADAKSRAEAYREGRLNGWMSINDVRKLENMNPVEGGDVHITPLNYIDTKLANEYYQSQIDKNKGSNDTNNTNNTDIQK